MKQFVLYKEPFTDNPSFKLSNILPGQHNQKNLCEFSFVSEIGPNRFEELSYPFSCKDVIIKIYNIIFKVGNNDTRSYYYAAGNIKERSFNKENGVSLLFYNTNQYARILENISYLQDLEKSIGITNDFTEIESVAINPEDFCSTFKAIKRINPNDKNCSIKNYLISPNPFWFSSELVFRFFLSFTRLLSNHKVELPSFESEYTSNKFIQFLYLGIFHNTSNDDVTFLNYLRRIPMNILENVLKYLFIFTEEEISKIMKIIESNMFNNIYHSAHTTEIFNQYSKIVRYDVLKYKPYYNVTNSLYPFLSELESLIKDKKRFPHRPYERMMINSITIFLSYFARHEINKDILEFKWAHEKSISKIKPVLNAVEPTVLGSTMTLKRKRTTTPATKLTVGTIPTPKKRVVRKKQVAVA